MLKRLLSLLLPVLLMACAPDTFVADPDKQCSSCEAWNQPQVPFQVAANSYYVGTAGLTAILIATSDGLILIDGGLPQSAALIDDNIRTLGFQTSDIVYILTSHAHYDHAGGIAALQRASKATVMASPETARALRQGMLVVDDPQYGFGIEANSFPAVENITILEDRDVIRLGEVQLTAYFTPGHTPGSTTWTWQSCDENTCLDLVYADSINPVSAPGFRFFAMDAAYDYRLVLQNTIATIRSLECDILLSPHPFYFAMESKLQQLNVNSEANPFIDDAACKAYADAGEVRLRERLEEESD